MKPYIYIFLLSLAFSSCTKNDDPTLELSREEWYLERLNTGGAVHLVIEGTTNADKITVKTFGDGLISDHEIDIKLSNHFEEDIVISFSVSSVPTSEFELSTDLKIYKKTNMITVTLTSDKLKY